MGFKCDILLNLFEGVKPTIFSTESVFLGKGIFFSKSKISFFSSSYEASEILGLSCSK